MLGALAVICICVLIYIFVLKPAGTESASKAVTVKLREGGNVVVSTPGIYYLLDGFYMYRGQSQPSWVLLQESRDGTQYVYKGNNTDSAGNFTVEGRSD